MLRDRKVHNATAFVCQHQENIENLKPDRRNRKEVRRNHVFHVILEKYFPALRRRSSVAHQILTHGRFADFDTELQQLTVNFGCTPERVVATHPADELPYFLRHGRSSALAVATLPCPE